MSSSADTDLVQAQARLIMRCILNQILDDPSASPDGVGNKLSPPLNSGVRLATRPRLEKREPYPKRVSPIA